VVCHARFVPLHPRSRWSCSSLGRLGRRSLGRARAHRAPEAGVPSSPAFPPSGLDGANTALTPRPVTDSRWPQPVRQRRAVEPATRCPHPRAPAGVTHSRDLPLPGRPLGPRAVRLWRSPHRLALTRARFSAPLPSHRGHPAGRAASPLWAREARAQRWSQPLRFEPRLMATWIRHRPRPATLIRHKT